MGLRDAKLFSHWGERESDTLHMISLMTSRIRQATRVIPVAKGCNEGSLAPFFLHELGERCSLVSDPAKAAENKQFPLVAADTNVLNCFVDDFSFACDSRSESEALSQGKGSGVDWKGQPICIRRGKHHGHTIIDRVVTTSRNFVLDLCSELFQGQWTAIRGHGGDALLLTGGPFKARVGTAVRIGLFLCVGLRRRGRRRMGAAGERHDDFREVSPVSVGEQVFPGEVRHTERAFRYRSGVEFRRVAERPLGASEEAARTLLLAGLTEYRALA